MCVYECVRVCVWVCVCVCECHGVYVHTLSQWIFPFFVLPLSCFSSWTFLLFSSSPLHLHYSFLVFLYSFLLSKIFFRVCLVFCPVFILLLHSVALRQKITHYFVIQKANTYLSISLILPEAWLADVNKHKHAVPATAYLPFLTIQRKQSR